MDKQSKTQQALQMMRDEGITAYAAAKRVGLTTTTVHNAWRKTQGICPCCGQRMHDRERLAKDLEDMAERADSDAARYYKAVADWLRQ